MPGESAKPSPPRFESMRQVVAGLRATRAEALVELRELDQAIDELRNYVLSLLRSARHAHTNIEQLATMQLLGQETASALSGNSRRLLSAVEQLDAAMDEVREGLDDWAIVEPPSSSS